MTPLKKRPLTLAAAMRMPEEPGVYVLLARLDSGVEIVNCVRQVRNLRRAIRRHVIGGDVPAVAFRAWTDPYWDDLRRLYTKLVRDHQPYYNSDAELHGGAL